MKASKKCAVFPKRLHDLRKERHLSQAELAHRIGTSGTIIGRYERGEITPSIEVAHRLAEVFGVTLDYLVGDEKLPAELADEKMLARWKALEGLDTADRDRILFVFDALLREAGTRNAYGT